MYKSRNIMPLLPDIKLMSRDRSIDLTGVLLRTATLFEWLRHNPRNVRQVSSM